MKDVAVNQILGCQRREGADKARHPRPAVEKQDHAEDGANGNGVQGHLLSGQIFGAFSREEREEIWSELRAIDGLIPSLPDNEIDRGCASTRRTPREKPWQ